MIRSPVLLNKENSALLVIDVQEKLVPAIYENESMADVCTTLVKGFRLLDLPVYYTEQYPQGIGPTVQPIKDALEGIEAREKVTFSCAGIEGFVQELRKEKIRNLVLCGIESHVCVWQSSVDFIHAGFSTVVAEDGVSSRTQRNKQCALKRMSENGVQVACAEMILFELMQTSEHEKFKEILALIK